MNKLAFALKNMGAVWRLAAFSNIPISYSFLKPQYPIAVCKITENCNSKCVGCNFHRSASKDMTYDEWISVFRQLAENNIRHIRFSGGEPMVRKDVYELIRAVTDLEFSLSMQSNILLLNELKIRKLVESGLRKISVSIDGINDNYSDYRGVDSFRVVRDAVLMLRDYFDEKQVAITPNIACPNLSALYKVVEFAEEMRIPITGFNLVNFTHYFFNDEAGYNRCTYEELDREELKKFCRFLAENRSKYLRISSVDRYAIIRYFENYHIPELPCLHPAFSMCIGSDGSVYGCCSMAAVGNVLKQPLKEILDSRKMAKLIKAALYKMCPGCSCGLYISSAMNIKYQLKSRFVKI